MVNADALEHYLFELVNWERSVRNIAPLKLEKNLNQAAEGHSSWMLKENEFSHTGIYKSLVENRIKETSFNLLGPWVLAENLAFQTERGDADYFDDILSLHVSLMNSKDHRANILNEELQYIGIGVEVGTFTHDTIVDKPSVMVTQNFARTMGNIDLDHSSYAEEQTKVREPQFSFLATTENLENIYSSKSEVYVLAGAMSNNVIDASESDIFLRGDADSNTLSGGAGNDTLAGDGGHDVLFGEAGNDSLNGSTGNDTLRGNAGNDTLSGENDNDMLYGGSGDDLMVGVNGTDTLYGEAGRDTVSGGAGTDVMYGGDGDDEMWGGSGNDTMWGGNGNDMMGGTEDNDLMYGELGNDTVWGGSQHDTLYGGDGVDTVGGFWGNDLAYGGEGNDFVWGNFGEDTLYGENGNDMIGGAEGRDILFGGDGRDTLIGGDDADQLMGGSGNDLLTGGSGDDWLFGGWGADTFYFFYNHTGSDRIADFNIDIDTIQFDTSSVNFNGLRMSQQGDNVVIDLNRGDITLVDIELRDLEADHFSFG